MELVCIYLSAVLARPLEARKYKFTHINRCNTESSQTYAGIHATQHNIHTAPNKTHSPSLQSRSTIISCVRVCLCMSPSSLPWVLSPPQLVSTFPPLHIPLLTITRSPSTFFSSLFPMTLALFLSRSFCYIDILSPPLYWDTPLTAPPVTLFMTTDLRGKCKVPPHQEIKTLASSHCLTPLTSLIFPHPFLHTPLPKSPLYHILFCFLFPPFSQLSQHCSPPLLLVSSHCPCKNNNFYFIYFLTAEVRRYRHLI